MESHKGYKIQGIIDEINKTQELVNLHESEKNDPVSAFMVKQYKGIKRKLLKELLAELLLADWNYKDMEHFIKRLTAYLKKSDEAATAPEELKLNLLKVEKLLVI